MRQIKKIHISLQVLLLAWKPLVDMNYIVVTTQGEAKRNGLTNSKALVQLIL